MNEEQPKTKLEQFAEKMEEKPVDPALTKIHNLAANISKSIPQPTDQPTDLIKEQIEKGKLLVGKGKLEVQAAKPEPKKGDVSLPPIPEPPPIVIDGHEFKRTNIPDLDALHVLMYIIADVFGDDPRVASILDQVQFQFPDKAGNLIYPKVKKRKAKQPNVRPSE